MRKKKLNNPMYMKYVDAMLELILQKGGLKEVNLRKVSKHIGFAHTNAYNYFESFDALIFAAYDKAVIHYGVAISKNLAETQDGNLIFLQFIKNIVAFAVEYTGYYRFIGTDDLKISELPDKTIQKAVEMKRFFEDLFYLTMHKHMSRKKSDGYSDIIMAYVDGELQTLINKRAHPNSNINVRLINNTIKLIELFILDTGCELSFDEPNPIDTPLPKLDFLDQV